MRVIGAAAVAAMMLTGCNSPAGTGNGQVQRSAAPRLDRSNPCPGDGARLNGSGVCIAAALAALPAIDAKRGTPEGCDWTVNETGLPGGEWMLYRALRCKGRTTRLDYAGGAHQAALSYGLSVYGGETWQGEQVAALIPAGPDPKAAIRAFGRAAIAGPKEAQGCDVRPAGFDGWPADAMVLDVSAAEAAKAPKDEPRIACGDYGLDEDTASFWRPVGPFAVFFTLGQDTPEVDAASFTVVGGAK